MEGYGPGCYDGIELWQDKDYNGCIKRTAGYVLDILNTVERICTDWYEAKLEHFVIVNRPKCSYRTMTQEADSFRLPQSPGAWQPRTVPRAFLLRTCDLLTWLWPLFLGEVMVAFCVRSIFHRDCGYLGTVEEKTDTSGCCQYFYWQKHSMGGG